MKIITNSPLLYMSACGGQFLNADGEIGVELPGTVSGPLPGLGGPGYTPPAPTPTAAPKSSNAAKGGKAKSLIGSGKVKGAVDSTAGLLNSLKGLFGGVKSATSGGNKGHSGGGSGIGSPAPSMPNDSGGGKAPMSTGAKIGIGLGIAVIVGLIIYGVTKKKK